MKTLREHLTALPRADLASLAERHGTSVDPVAPAELAALLASPETILRSATLLTIPQLQVAQALALRSAGTRRRDLAALLGVPAGDTSRQVELLAWRGRDPHRLASWLDTAFGRLPAVKAVVAR